MLKKCNSYELFGIDCKYGGIIDTEKEAYSIRKIGEVGYDYHYRCGIDNDISVIRISRDSRDKLIYLLKQVDSPWIDNILKELES